MTALKPETLPEDVRKLAEKIAILMEAHAAIGTTTRAKIDEIAHIIMADRAARPDPAQTWQPIETAPKDGTAVIVAIPAGPTELWIVGEAHYEHRDGTSEDGWWWAQEGPGDEYSERLGMWLAEPVQWMPLPAPPNLLKDASHE